MLQLNISNMLRNKGIDKPYTWLRQQKISHRIAYKLVSGEQKMMSIRLMSRICEAAWCTPAELFVYEAGTSTVLPEGHPLSALAPAQPMHFAERLRRLSPEKLKELDGLLDELGDKK
jgi:DNA-binding Xre family transcriptional regulator